MSTILLATVTEIEGQAVLDLFSKATKTKWERYYNEARVYYALGRVGESDIFMVQSEMGSVGPGGMTTTIRDAINYLKPSAVIMVGIAFGMKPEKQKLGDILVARQLMLYEPQKVRPRKRIWRGDKVTTSIRLIDKFRSSLFDWVGVAVHFGLMLSGEKLVADKLFRQSLLKKEPESIGGEMEGAGLYAACVDKGVDWILVKAICDWGDESKNDNNQTIAALNSTEFVLHTIKQGGLAYKNSALEYNHNKKLVFATPDHIPSKGISQVPPPPSDFTGRDEEIRELLERFEGRVVISALRGLGGVGKTALALALTQRLTDRFPDAQLMVNMHGTDDNALTPSDALSIVVHAFQPGADLPDSEVQLRDLYVRTLQGKQALILLDNVRDVAQISPLMPPESCGMLITSRQTIVLPGLLSLRLDALKPSAAVQLMTSIAPRLPSLPPGGLGEHIQNNMRTDANITAKIARLCGYLPLALRAAGSLLAIQEDLDPVIYANQLNNERTRLGRIGGEGVDVDVAASFELSYQRLPLETQRVFASLSVFPADFDAVAAEVICQDPEHIHTSLLVRHNLVDYSQSTEATREIGGRYRLHDLARLFAAQQLPETKKVILYRRYATYYLEILNKVEQLYERGGVAAKQGLVLFDIERSNIEAGQQRATDLSGVLTNIMDLGVHTQKYSRWSFFFRWLLQVFRSSLHIDATITRVCIEYVWNTNVLHLRLHPMLHIRWIKVGLEAARRLHESWATSILLSQLGRVYSSLGEYYEANKCYEQKLSTSRSMGDRAQVMYALEGLGYTYLSLGQHQKATEYYNEMLAISRMVGDRLSEVYALNGLSSVYHFLGEDSKSIKFCEQSVAFARQLGNPRWEAKVLGWLALRYDSIGDYQRAIEYHKLQLTIAQAIESQSETMFAYSGLGNAYRSVGEYKKAVEYHNEALTLTRELGDKVVEKIILGYLGNDYHFFDNYREAADYYKQYLTIARELNHRASEAEALGNLGNANRDLGNYRQAINNYKEAIQIVHEQGQKQNEAEITLNLGLTYSLLGEYGNAIISYKRAFALFKVIGFRQVDPNANWNQASVHQIKDDLVQAIALEQIYLDYMHNINHPDTNKRVAKVNELHIRLKGRQIYGYPHE